MVDGCIAVTHFSIGVKLLLCWNLSYMWDAYNLIFMVDFFPQAALLLTELSVQDHPH